jgi:hypothetical protein
MPNMASADLKPDYI